MVKGLASVLIPCYNHEKFIINTLESVKSNHYQPKEVIFIDDGSKDQSYELARDFFEAHKENFSRYICLKQDNRGVTKTLNRMIEMAQGEYILLLASDDYLTENSIEDRIRYLEQNPDKGVVIGKSYLVDAEGHILHNNAAKKLYRANAKMLSSRMIDKELIMRWSVVGPTFLAKRDVYDKIGTYNENLRVEDREFFLRLIKNHLLGYMDENIAYYRVHSLNTSRTATVKQRAALLKEISGVNIAFSRENFGWDERLFLSSYKIDKMLIDKGNYRILQLFKAFRAALCEVYLFFVRMVIRRDVHS